MEVCVTQHKLYKTKMFFLQKTDDPPPPTLPPLVSER